ncbi:WLM-domain-containing protein [Serendipita vermifera]|nr:WLM-domain-containing protein [Serendipita vermifera]
MSLVKSFTHLKDKPHGEKALEMLQRVASLVKPIMRKRGWTLPVLSEFFPSDPSLLVNNFEIRLGAVSNTFTDVNQGQKIFLRLRPPHSPDRFYDEEDVVGTMLHELTHNVHGPHNDQFYKYLGELQNEYAALRAKGYSGEGFHSAGRRVGEGVSHNVPLSQARSKAALAAEKRQNMTKILSNGGGQRLGGGQRVTTKTPRELAAEAAARRARDEKACGSTSQEAIERETQRAMEESVLDVPSATESPLKAPEIPSSSSSQPASRPIASSSSLPVKRKAPEISQSIPTTGLTNGINEDISSVLPEAKRAKTISNGGVPVDSLSTRQWACQICTLLNDEFILQCDACGTNKPVDPAKGWTCLGCGTGGNKVEWWTCMDCGRMKSEVLGG